MDEAAKNITESFSCSKTFVQNAAMGEPFLCVLHRRTFVRLPISPILHFDENKH